VAKVRLFCLDTDRQDFLDANGATIGLIYLRLSTMLRIGPSGYLCDGLVDTGSAFSVFPELIWRRTASGLTGGTFPCRVGRIAVTVFDLQRNEISNVPVIGKFLNDGGKLRPRALVGLGFGLFDQRVLHIDIDGRDAWLEDRPKQKK
jgi:hypothetical protein